MRRPFPIWELQYYSQCFSQVFIYPWCIFSSPSHTIFPTPTYHSLPLSMKLGFGKRYSSRRGFGRSLADKRILRLKEYTSQRKVCILLCQNHISLRQFFRSVAKGTLLSSSRRLASGEGIVVVGVCLSVCVSVCHCTPQCRIIVGGVSVQPRLNTATPH